MNTNTCINALFLQKYSIFPEIDETIKVYENDDQGRIYRNCQLHDPLGRDCCAMVWSYKSYSENALYL